MKSWNVRLLAASYSKDDITVQLFGRTDKNKSITILYDGFRPYFFAVEPTTGELDSLKGDQNVLGIEELELWHDGRSRRCVKITVTQPWTVPDYRRKFTQPLAADIPFHHRFIYDKDLSSCIKVNGEELENDRYTTDIIVKASDFENIEPFKPNLKILSFDIENSIQTNEIFTICHAISSGKRIKKGSIVGDEKSMIKEFIELIIEEDPDVITGYNIDGYDLPLLLERARVHRIEELKIGRDRERIRQVNNRFWRLPGRIVADAWWNVKREIRPKQETLNAVAKELLGEEKEDVNPIEIDREWAEDREKVIKYCVKDAVLALKILQKIAVLEKNMDLATVSSLPLDDVINGRTSLLIDSILIREADKNNVGVPMTGSQTKKKPIEGGYVHTINPGVYDWVCILDFKSMYPSLMIAKNICFTTFSKEGTIISPEAGVRYLDKSVKVGLLPQVLERLMTQRDEIKARMKETDSEEEKQYLNGLQDAIKILMNSVYGVFASAFYRFTNPKIGESITAFARENTKSIIKQLGSEGLKVVYGDTDSVFFQSPEDDLDGTVKFGKKIAKRYSKEGAVLEFEAVYNPLFSHGVKKRYVGQKVWPDEGMVVRGYEIRRSDSFDLQSKSLSKIFEEVMKMDTNSAIREARTIVTELKKGNAEVEELVISRSCKPFERYKNPDSQTTVQIAKKLISLGYDFVPGMKVSWVVTNGKQSPIEAEPFISGIKFEKEPDYEYYARRIAMSLSRVTDVFGWDFNSLMTGSQQTDLFGDKFGGEDVSIKKEKPKVKKTDKKLTLEDFL